MKFNTKVMAAFWNLNEQETPEAFELFKATFLEFHSEQEWELCVAFFNEFGGALLCEFV